MLLWKQVNIFKYILKHSKTQFNTNYYQFETLCLKLF